MSETLELPKSDESPDSALFYAKTDMTILIETFKTIAQENKKSIDELAKLHRSMYNEIIQKQNSELEAYRRGALRQSKVNVLRAVAEIYSENNQSIDAVENPAVLLSDVMSLLEELFENNDVQIVRSKPGDLFDRKFMRTQERYIIPTPEHGKDRTIVKSIRPGFLFFGEPLLQEVVGIYKYDSKQENNTDVILPNESSVNKIESVSEENKSISSSDHAADKIIIESEEINHV